MELCIFISIGYVSNSSSSARDRKEKEKEKLKHIETLNNNSQWSQQYKCHQQPTSSLCRIDSGMLLDILSFKPSFATEAEVQPNLDYPDLDYPDLDYPDFSITRSLSRFQKAKAALARVATNKEHSIEV